jgi:hypothetical protein
MAISGDAKGQYLRNKCWFRPMLTSLQFSNDRHAGAVGQNIGFVQWYTAHIHLHHRRVCCWSIIWISILRTCYVYAYVWHNMQLFRSMLHLVSDCASSQYSSSSLRSESNCLIGTLEVGDTRIYVSPISHQFSKLIVRANVRAHRSVPDKWQQQGLCVLWAAIQVETITSLIVMLTASFRRKLQ